MRKFEITVQLEDKVHGVNAMAREWDINTLAADAFSEYVGKLIESELAMHGFDIASMVLSYNPQPGIIASRAMAFDGPLPPVAPYEQPPHGDDGNYEPGIGAALGELLGFWETDFKE